MRKVYKTGIKLKNEKMNLLDLEENLPKNDSIINFTGNRELHIDGFRCIVEYTGELIKVNLLKGMISIIGESLCIVSLGNDEITVNGKINSVEFC